MHTTWNYNVLWGISMRLILSILFALVISSCSVHKSETVQLFDAYNKLSQETKYGDILAHRNEYFTSTYLKGVNPDDKDSIFLLRLTNYVDENLSHYQSIEDGSACLSINGTDENNEPLSLHIEYKKTNGKWLINYMFVHFLENSSSFSKSVICPREAEKNIMKLMHNNLLPSQQQRILILA